ncbi:hypothetical protein Pcinc_016122 [Petrolisthes cinctipes]|uniref:PCI domain-containing protein n=1 Tax=Petrolisthes cinctipes TaxID=88211 RepID=A0AAE1KQ11_PETCI|nr:hypothetical protein Pcinc_016122 [Petrolisthes cinctipes]
MTPNKKSKKKSPVTTRPTNDDRENTSDTPSLETTHIKGENETSKPVCDKLKDDQDDTKALSPSMNSSEEYENEQTDKANEIIKNVKSEKSNKESSTAEKDLDSGIPRGGTKRKRVCCKLSNTEHKDDCCNIDGEKIKIPKCSEKNKIFQTQDSLSYDGDKNHTTRKRKLSDIPEVKIDDEYSDESNGKIEEPNGTILDQPQLHEANERAKRKRTALDLPILEKVPTIYKPVEASKADCNCEVECNCAKKSEQACSITVPAATQYIEPQEIAEMATNSTPEINSKPISTLFTHTKTLFVKLCLTEEQQDEVNTKVFANSNNSDLSVPEIWELLTSSLLNGTITLTTMNTPRFHKFLRQILTQYCSLDVAEEKKHTMSERLVKWAQDKKSLNLRHDLELTRMNLYYDAHSFKQAETVASSVYAETKKLQDYEKTVKACLCLSRVYLAMGNVSRARSSITTAKTEALKVYTPPDLQADLDFQSGIMQLAEKKDMETAFSYFKEAASGFILRKKKAKALKYMLLSKIMANRSDEGIKVVWSQRHIEDIDDSVKAMLKIATAADKALLAEFKQVREEEKQHLCDDAVVVSVLDELYTIMVEKNLLSIVKPYERLQIDHVASCIKLPRDEVERRLSQMILDRQLSAQLDHRDDCLYMYPRQPADPTYKTAISTLASLDKTITHLHSKAKKIL